MKIKNCFELHIQSFFEELGFEKIKGPWISYQKSEAGKRVNVDFYCSRELNKINVSIQVFTEQGVRGIGLEEFKGKESYSYSRADVKSIQEVADEILLDIKAWGIPWIDGKDVQSQGMQKTEGIVNEYRFRKLLENSRKFLKENDFQSVINCLEEARLITTLDQYHERIFSLAKKKL
ncbi:MAG: hypothetical protein KDC71_22090 [Acidobacteria bacterium]|nr:hypothetical protein [Acidobacteriota bacterium]